MTTTLIAGCDAGREPDGPRHVEVDAAAAAVALAELAARGEPPSFAAVQALLGDDAFVAGPTLRDLVDGTIPPMYASSEWSRIGEACPQAAPSRLQAADAAPVAVAVRDERSLDTPIAAACAVRDLASGRLSLSPCGEVLDAAGSPNLGLEVVDLSSTVAAIETDCYWCDAGFPCNLQGKDRRYEGYQILGKCLAVGYYGCC